MKLMILIAGLAVGFGAGLLLRPSAPPSPAAPAPSKPIPAADSGEVKALRVRIGELEGKLAEKAVAAPPAVPPAPMVDVAAKFAALAGKGLAAYGGPEFQELAKAVKEQGKAALDVLVQALLKGGKSQERFMAAAILEAAGDPAAIPALAEALQADSDLLVRRMASHALAVLGTEAAEAPLRASMTGDKDWGVRVNSAYGVAKLGKEDGLRLLEQSYSGGDTPAEYRLAILSGLADVAATSTAPLFRRILADTKDETYLFLAVAALSKMKDAGARADLERLAASSEVPETLRDAARKALEELGR